ncbi:IS1/IS1595 family N-terminal zinc-binding domain-containing protein [Budvicia diplopodorum]|uniref:IS1/IS1595 family N-terminal zinc-binding domain-containing protein n=1 Tax=Budvicia diplopodorum TaxID=1119056 RepID=UPI0013595D3C|nr:hypothetical protein [Budvicia diplopodorum]
MEIKHNPCCHYCEDKNHIRRHGKSRAGIARYLCTACNRTFQTNYIYHSNEDEIHRLIKKLLDEGKSNFDMAAHLGVGLNVISRHTFMLANESKQ